MMLFRYATVVLILSLAGGSSFSAAETLHVYGTLDTARKEITGWMEYTVPSRPGLNSFEFQLYPELYASAESPYLRRLPDLLEHYRRSGRWASMAIDSVRLDGRIAEVDLTLESTRGIMTVPEGENLNDRIIRLYFRTSLPEWGDRLSYHNDEYVLSQWFPCPARLTSSGWINPEYGPFAEPVGPFLHYDVEFRLPSGFIVAAPVPPVSERTAESMDYYRYSFGPAHDFALAVSPRYLIDSSSVDGTILKIYYREGERRLIESIRLAVSETFAFMSDRAGQYAYDYFTVATADAVNAAGIEFPGMTVLRSPRGRFMITNYFESLVIHETVHQWFYALVASDPVVSPWLDESVTEFFTGEILSGYRGSEANFMDVAGWKMTYYDYHRSQAEGGSGSYGLNSAAGDFINGRDYFGTIYARGPLIVETFDNLLGDSLSAVFWSRYFRENLFDHADEKTFLETAGEVGGDDIEEALKTMLTSPAAIDYAVFDLRSRPYDSARYEVAVVLVNRGGLDVPIDYQLVLSTRDTIEYIWYPETDIEEIMHYVPAPAVAAVIDPHHLIACDDDLFNNSLLRGAESGPGMRLTGKIMFLIESLLSLAGGL